MSEERGAIHGKDGPSRYGAVETVDGGSSTGKSPDVQVTQEIHYYNVNSWGHIKHKFREAFAEFLGTFIFVTFGISSIAQAVLSDGANGNLFTISVGFGIGLALAIAVSGSVSGGHLNPAVTITLAVFRRFPWLKVPIYTIAQTLGGFVAAAVVYTNYASAISNFDGGERKVAGVNATAAIFATYPVEFISTANAFFSEALGTFFLLIVILAVTDEKNHPISKFHAPFSIGLALTVIIVALGYLTGASLNGARDFGPRLFTFFIGYGIKVFSANHFYFWVPLVAPIVGGLTAGLVYDGLIYTGKSPLNVHH